MPHLVMQDFELMTMVFLTKSTSATQANKAWEVGKEMEIDFRKTTTKVGTRILEESST
jgi:hypothetical protein